MPEGDEADKVKAADFLYVDSEQMKESYALPSAFRAYMKWV